MNGKVTRCENGLVRIESLPSMNNTGYAMVKGTTYYFRTTGQWQDSKGVKPCDGDGFDKWYLYIAFFLRTYKTAPWFCLIGKIGDQLIRMGKEGRFVAERNGTLFCFANDAPFARGNNIGHICLEVQDHPF